MGLGSTAAIATLLASLLTPLLPAAPWDPKPGDAVPTFDPETGKSLAHFPLSPQFDHLHMRLELWWPDPTQGRLSASETLTVTPRGNARSLLKLNGPLPAHLSQFSAKATDGRRIDVTHVGDELIISCSPEVRLGEQFSLEFKYTLDFSDAKGDGLTFHPGNPEAASPTEKAGLIFSQGQAELNRQWFICHDFPNERLTTETVIHAPPGYQAVSNGSLIEHTTQPTEELWHWKMSKPHVNYLVMVAVGQFAKIDLDDAVVGPPTQLRHIPCSVWAPIGKEDQVKSLFATTPRMVEYFSTRFDMPYPWERYDQVLVRDYPFGGMENTTATILGDKMLQTPKDNPDAKHADEDPDDLISHELAHQWFGDCLTCRSWEHIWLNEGWATYAEALWQFHKHGEGEAGLTALRATLEHYRDDQAIHNIDPAPTSPSIADRRYKNPDDVFAKSDDPYAKGAWILHMLHEQLGDHAFWRGVHSYLRTWAFSEVETSDFRRALEAASGESLEQFFLQWCKTPGIPSIEYSVTWDRAAGTATVQWRQLQAIDAGRPAWILPLAVRFRREKEIWDRTIPIDQRTGVATFTLTPGDEPELEPDPNMASLCSVRSVRAPEPAAR